MNKNLYEVLGVKEDADLPTLKARYRQLAFELHPDRTQGDKEKEDRFKDVQMAYAVLSDPDKRKAYDTIKHDRKHPLFGPEFDALVERIRDEGITGDSLSDILGEFFGVCKSINERAKQQMSQSSNDDSFLGVLSGIFGIKIDIPTNQEQKRKP